MVGTARVNRTYRFRIYPTSGQRIALDAQLAFACDLYNAALEQRRYARRTGAPTNHVSQCRELTDLRGHRDLPASATVRMVTVRRVLKRWYASFVLALTTPVPTPRRMPAVGLDLGVRHFVALSTGEVIPGPRASRATSRRCRMVQRRVSRRLKGSRRRAKAGFLLARLHERVRNLRRDHAHKLSRRLVSNFSLIAVEDLNIGGLARGPLSKDVNDQGWAEFLRQLGYKAEDAGIRVVNVPPGGTSQACSNCGVDVPKQLSERTHDCHRCGLLLDRDVNAARNILRLGLSRQATTWPTGACVA